MAEDLKQSESYVDSIAKHEHEALGQRSSSERLADAVASLAGIATCIALHLVVVFVWAFANLVRMPIAHPFDPFPFRCRGSSLLSKQLSFELRFDAPKPDDAQEFHRSWMCSANWRFQRE